MDEKLFELIPQVDLSCEENIEKFKIWQHEDGTIEGLLDLLEDDNPDDYELRMLKLSGGSFPEDFEHENGNYVCVCSICQFEFVGHKRRVVCKKCETENDRKPIRVAVIGAGGIAKSEVLRMLVNTGLENMHVVHVPPKDIIKNSQLNVCPICDISDSYGVDYEAMEKASRGNNRQSTEEIKSYELKVIGLDEKEFSYEENHPKKKKGRSRMEKMSKYGGKW